MKPVYIINGFLDAGKTDFFRYTIAQPYFRTKGKTLLIVCEEGENDYDEKLLKSTNTVIHATMAARAATISIADMIRNKPRRVRIEK